MAITQINVGNIANDGTGDDLRQAFVKVNNNFTELDARVVPQNNAENLGTGVGVYYTKENNVLNFRSLIAGDNMSLSADGTSITITNNGTIAVRTDGDTLTLSGAGRSFGINGGQNINTSLVGNNITVSVDTTDLVFQDSAPALGGDLNAANRNITNVNVLTATTISGTAIVGPLTGTVNGINVEDLDRVVNGSDYGVLSDNRTSSIQLLFQATVIDYGTVTSPSSLISDYGAI